MLTVARVVFPGLLRPIRNIGTGVLAALLLGACAAPEPEVYGLYARDSSDRLTRLDGDSDWERRTWSQRADLPDTATFVIFDPSVAQASRTLLRERVSLRRVAKVRLQVEADGEVRPADDVAWIATDLPEHRVPLDFRPMEDQPQAVEAVPRGPLAPGLYALQVRGEGTRLKSRFGVDWDEVDQVAYGSRYCVDRYSGEDAGEAVRFAPCSALPDPRDFSVSVGQASYRDGAEGRELVIEGAVRNRSREARDAPALRAELKGADGQELMSWSFEPPARQLAPGQTIQFSSRVRQPPGGVEQVTVAVRPRPPVAADTVSN